MAMVPDQRDWRFCTKCTMLFFNDVLRDNRGTCPRDHQGHDPRGFNFEPQFHPDLDLADTPTTQSRWRFCGKCHVMFFQGSPPRDRKCAADGGTHEEIGFHFMLPVNRAGAPALVPETPTGQGGWRFCGKCTSLFFDGFADKGVCPRDDGGHASIGDTFVLPHDQHPSIRLTFIEPENRNRVLVSGIGFVPDERVVFLRDFHTSSGGFNQGPGGETRTDNNGNFDFDLDLGQAHVTNLNVQAQDAFTSLVAVDHLD